MSRPFLCLGFVVSQSIIVSGMACLFCGAECVVSVATMCDGFVIIMCVVVFDDYNMPALFALYLILAGPALFRGRLRAFGKRTNGVAVSKGRPNLASVRLTL